MACTLHSSSGCLVAQRAQVARRLVCRPIAAKPTKPAAKSTPAEAVTFRAPDSYKMIPTELVLPAPAYNFLKYSQLALYLAIYDAGWSRDWLRVGWVNIVEEHVLQSVFWFIMTAHAVVGLVAANFAAKSTPQYPPLSAGLQGFLFGTLGLYDVYLQVQDATAAAAPATSGKRK